MVKFVCLGKTFVDIINISIKLNVKNMTYKYFCTNNSIIDENS